MTAIAPSVGTMTALVFTGPSTVEIQEVPRPVAADGEILIDIVACGICGSELHGIRHVGLRKPPLIMGHEISGTTADGRRVTVNPLFNCGTCDMCIRDDVHLCREREILGIHRPGAFAQQVVVPAASVWELPDDVDFDTACMIEPLANAVHALRLAAPESGARIGVIGAGTIGLGALLVALQYSTEVCVSDLAPERLAHAASFGATHVGPALEGEFDVIIDAVGAAATHSASIDLLRPGGTAVWIGLLSDDSGFDGQEIVRSEKRVIGSYCYTPDDFGQALNLARRVPAGWTTRFELSEGVEIFGELMNGRHDLVKAVLRPQQSATSS
ncbi:zinc-dependent alcohol dehydrogenase [Aeromicrobium sp. P5_D10]